MNKEWQLDELRKKSIFKKQFYCLALAPAKKIPKEYGLEVYNIYSDKDGITGRWADEKDEFTYNVEILECKAKKSFNRGLKEHSFMGSTLQKGLNDKVIDIRKERGFYNGNTR